jgi:CDP-glycerol glycerophosphotransferase (TagB/SpsB family)
MSKKKSAGFICSAKYPYLDHLAPFCSLSNIPLIVTESHFAKIAKKFYPKTKIITNTNYPIIYKFLAENFDIIFSCQLHLLELTVQLMLGTFSDKTTTVWISHGLSDKAFENDVFQALKREKFFLVYGQKMWDAFKAQKIIKKNSNKFILGNFRYHYYLKNKSFYKNLLLKEIENLNPSNKTILYAPTWDSAKHPKHLLETFKTLIKNLPKNYNLIIKPHPNTYKQLGFELERIKWESENIKNIFFIKRFPPIYPLIDFCDVYLGDTSSIGYDFLTFNKPMFFLNHNKKDSKKMLSLNLFKCGHEIMPNQYQNIFSIIEKNIENDREKFSNLRKKVYDYSFSKTPDFENLLKTIEQLHLNSLKS